MFPRIVLIVISDKCEVSASDQVLITGPAEVAKSLLFTRLGVKLLASNCSSFNRKLNQCCQLSTSLTNFLILYPRSNWVCHFDDDSFVNINQLEKTLSQFDSSKKFYVGRSSLSTPYSFKEKNKEISNVHHFFFATGGAGICLTRSLLESLRELLHPEKFTAECERTGLSDDVLLGYLISNLHDDVPLTISNRLHSHLEDMALLKPEFVGQQISLSYDKKKIKPNSISLSRQQEQSDPTGFYQLSCIVYGRSSANFNCKTKSSL
ncbi:fringe glycosyltransferase-like isoform X2 [Convolutriloba macropyga]|uniref:fringe glycosyltransferase-like isoform X2 n=1 Tax=Convolutriloba macropyga TaxID=536237 RepID=UPI003F527984